MIDPDLLRTLGWSTALIDEVVRLGTPMEAIQQPIADVEANIVPSSVGGNAVHWSPGPSSAKQDVIWGTN
jgi:hypothetical protein